MAYGKTIELFLVNGTTDSIVEATLSNWNGKAIRLPRTEVQICERKDFKAGGVYFLFCPDEKGKGKEGVYIGESETIQERLLQHIRDHKSGKEKFYWNTAVTFTGSDLDKADIHYLEDQLVKQAKSCAAYHVYTQRTNVNTFVKESRKEALNEFLDYLKLLIKLLGYKVFEIAPKAEDDTVYLYCKGSGGDAKGFLSSGGFTVLKGAKTSEKVVSSLQKYNPGYYMLRQKLEAGGTIKDHTFQFDYEFNSPTAAAAVIEGRPANGNTEWKTGSGTTLKDLDTTPD